MHAWIHFSRSSPCSPPRFLDEANATFKNFVKWLGTGPKIKTNHAWTRPKRGGDTRLYTPLSRTKLYEGASVNKKPMHLTVFAEEDLKLMETENPINFLEGLQNISILQHMMPTNR